MAYYTDLKPRGTPLNSNVITPNSVRSLLNLPIAGGSLRSQTLLYRLHKSEESYNGFQIPRYVKISLSAKQESMGHTFFVCMLSGELELLHMHPDLKWPDWSGENAPTQADWDAVFIPVDDPVLLKTAEQIFAAVVTETKGHRVSDVTDEENLSAVPHEQVAPKKLSVSHN